VVAILGANTNGIAAKTFDSTETGTVNGTLTPMISGTFGNYVSQTESTFTSTNAPEHATFYGAAQGATAITGMDLQGEDDSMYVYMQWQGYQAASVTPNTGVASVGGTVTLTNAPSNDNIFTPTDGTGPFNNGLRADAWVSAITPNQTWTGGGGWSFSNFAADTLNSTTTTNGTVIAGGGSPVSATVNFTPSAQMLTGTYGATISVGLENEQDIQGTSNNDLTPVAFIVQGGTVNNGAGPQAGNYSLNGGTLSAPATTLSGMYTQTGGQATFVSLVDTGTAVISGGTLTIGSLSINGGLLKLSSSVSGGSGPAVTSTINLSSVSITGSGQLDVYNNHVIITYGASDPFSTIAGYIKSGYNNGAWNGPGIISTAAQIKTNGLSYGVGYADGKDGVVSGLVSGQIEVAYTLLGDANLDGLVNAADFSILAANFNQTVTGWDQGDFNYDGIVNAADFTDLAANFNQPDSGAASAGDVAALDAFAAANGLSLPTSSVPEPASGALALFGVGMLARRARRRDDR
jgi:MYXO-CTERM domain-containing protein